MKQLILATAAVLSLATAGAALAQRTQDVLPELAASGLPQQDTDSRGTNYAANGLPQQNTDAQSQVAMAGGEHPAVETNRPSMQLAASGVDWARRAHGEG